MAGPGRGANSNRIVWRQHDFAATSGKHTRRDGSGADPCPGSRSTDDHTRTGEHTRVADGPGLHLYA